MSISRSTKPGVGAEIVDARLRIEMFGSLRIVRGDDEIVRFALQKAAGLIAYLALSRRPQPREHLVDLFWPDMDLPAGRDNLSTTLASLRRQIEPPGVRRGTVLIATHSAVGLNTAALSTDVADFERLLDSAADDGGRGDIDRLRHAVELYRGDLLREFYFDWSIGEMERLQVRYQDALRRLSGLASDAADYDTAIAAAQKLVASDSYSEDAHVALIRLLAGRGHYSLAREARGRLIDLFVKEFGGPPAPAALREIDDLLGGLRIDSARPHAKAPPAPYGPQTSVPNSKPSAEPLRPQPTIPAVFSRFFGREEELARLAHLILPHKASDPGIGAGRTRLASVIGPGGIGKSRLALEFARQASERFGHFCAFVPLAEVADPAMIPGEIAAAMRLSLDSDPGQDAIGRICEALVQYDRPNNRPILVLDNLEHLLVRGDSGDDDAAAGATLETVRRLLAGCLGLAIVATSRVRLGLRGEEAIVVPPLSLPEPQAGSPVCDLGDLSTNASVRLYLDRAQSVRPDFALTQTNAPAVTALCRQLDGSPLALELAAAWVRSLPPRKMWERLTAGLDIPQGGYGDLPARHRSLTATLQWSHRLLTRRQQALFACASVFRGGWSVEAAEAVSADPDAMMGLDALAESSLVTTGDDYGDDELRYGFLDIVRRFAEQKAEEESVAAEASARHAGYFLRFAEAAEPQLRGPDQAKWLVRLECEHDNLRAALAWCLGPGERFADAVRLAAALARFWRVHGHWHEALRWLQAATDDKVAAAADRSTLSRALNALGSIEHEQASYVDAKRHYEAALVIRRDLGETARVADSLHNLGYLALIQSRYDEARTHYEAALALQRQLKDQSGIADELHHLGLLAHQQSDLETARRWYSESLALRRGLGDKRGVSHTVNNLANIAHAQGDFELAQDLHRQTLEIRRSLGDKKGIADSLLNLGKLASSRGSAGEARRLSAEAATLHHELGDRAWTCMSLDAVAIAILAGSVDIECAAAARLFAAAAVERSALGLTDSAVSEHESWWEIARKRLGEETFRLAWSSGETMPLGDAVAMAAELGSASAEAGLF